MCCSVATRRALRFFSPVLFTWAFSTMSFPLSTAVTVARKSGYPICSSSFHSIKPLISLFIAVSTYFSLSRELFSCDLSVVSVVNLWWSDGMQGVISDLLYLLRLVFKYMVDFGDSSKRCKEDNFFLYVWVNCL